MEPPISQEQYQILAARRVARDGMLWQTPTLSVTGQAFLFSIALGSDTGAEARMIAALLAFVVSLASIQLMAKQRYFEVRNSKLLRLYEDLNAHNRVVALHGRIEDAAAPWYLATSSYRLWLAMLAIFGGAAITVFVGVLFSPEWLARVR